jgi:phospholipase/carboxylesterase
MSNTIIVQQPTLTKQLFLLFHGVGAKPESLLPAAKAIAVEFPLALVVCVAAPFDSDIGRGYQWFSVRGITEANRMSRIQDVMPVFLEEIKHWQNASLLGSAETALIGFSQGAIMALHASTTEPAVAARIVGHSGRYAELPPSVSAKTTLHLIHGKNDEVIEYRHCVEAAHHLKSIGADFTADVIPFLTHGMSNESIALMIKNLKEHIPQYVWDARVELSAPPLK